jgi:hypothetical protein
MFCLFPTKQNLSTPVQSLCISAPYTVPAVDVAIALGWHIKILKYKKIVPVSCALTETVQRL